MKTGQPSCERRAAPARRAAQFLDPRPRTARFAEQVRRARQYSGHERQVALLVAKSGLAAILAWFLAVDVVGTSQPSYAPFTALLVVQSTVYRSLLQSLRYVAAVVLGVGAAGFADLLLGRDVAAFAVMTVLGLLVGRWHRLGQMGIQVPVAGVFAYTALSGSQPVALWSIVSMVLLGAATGLVVNLVLLPPMRYGTASEGLQELATAVHTLLRDVSDGLRRGTPDAATTRDWAGRSRDLDDTVARARYAVEHGAESISYNPRRLLSRRAPAGFTGYRTMVESLHRATDQLRGITTSLRYAVDGEDDHVVGEEFLRAYGEFLSLVAAAAWYCGGTDEEAKQNLAESLHSGYERYEQLVHETVTDDVWPSMGALLADAARLLEEFDRAQYRGALRPW
jgi:aromatic acid exporter family member 1